MEYAIIIKIKISAVVTAEHSYTQGMVYYKIIIISLNKQIKYL